MQTVQTLVRHLIMIEFGGRSSTGASSGMMHSQTCMLVMLWSYNMHYPVARSSGTWHERCL